ncbi:MAG TPA: 2-dehydropantoate 2-reductase [Dehalococcoidia bacterium]|nr:2-dehydropantoate 2-reductase [Dehalococcoidia bacterium]
MRYVIYGAGAIGGVIAAELARHGHDVAVIARGAHLEAIRARGLTLECPDETVTQRIAAYGHPREVAFTPDDVVLLCMKTQDTTAALAALEDAAGPDVPVFCVQNGVENERLALRRFARVYGVLVIMPATHLEPGIVQSYSTPLHGILDLGRYPSGTDALAEEVAATLSASRFSARALADVMRWKYAKLLSNLSNALQAICGLGREWGDLSARAVDEALACYRAAGIACAGREEMDARRRDAMREQPIAGRAREGGSSWQSLARGAGSIEADYLNGEIVLLGRLHGVPTPVNELLRRTADRMARERLAPGAVTADDLRAALADVPART